MVHYLWVKLLESRSYADGRENMLKNLVFLGLKINIFS